MALFQTFSEIFNEKEQLDANKEESFELIKNSGPVYMAVASRKALPTRCRPLTVHVSNIVGRSQQGLVSYRGNKKVRFILI